jgi:hypothetical protein
VLPGETPNSNFIDFGLTRSGLEPTIYHTRGEHANHYTTDEPTIYHTRGEHANHYTTDEPTIYHTRGEHANHYTTDAVQKKKDKWTNKDLGNITQKTKDRATRNISVISWWSVLLVEENGVPGENPGPVASHWQT